MIELDEEFESILICAARYACGRRTYMPSIVIDYITPLIPVLSDKTLVLLRNDIGDALMWGGLGVSNIDAPLWLGQQQRIGEELKRRKNE
jgi:hypothetical protein